MVYHSPPIISLNIDSGKMDSFGHNLPFCGLPFPSGNITVHPGLQLNLRFEIELLCDILNLEISDLRLGTALKVYPGLSKLPSFKALGANSSPG